MTDLFLIAAGKVDSVCGGLLPLVKLIRQAVFPTIQIIIPIILIVWGTIDLGKAVIASDEKAVKAAQGMLIKRAIYAAAIFFIVTLVSLLMNIISKAQADDADTKSWAACWDAAKPGKK